MSVRVFAPAKINLTLKVGPPRADGLHPLQSVVVFADAGDWVAAAPADALSLRVSGPFAQALEGEDDNLVLRAARALAEAAGVAAPGATLSLEKHLPVASGIGGGSSDAAAALKALNALWALGLGEAQLAKIARGLGADVPVCVGARPAYMTGAGETFAPMRAPVLHAVLSNPQIPLPTPDVYRRFDAMGLGAPLAGETLPHWPEPDTAFAAIAAVGNDLTPAAAALAPALAHMAAVLRDDARVRVTGLSGSGATMFALVEDAAAAKTLAHDVSLAHPAWWVQACVLGAA